MFAWMARLLGRPGLSSPPLKAYPAISRAHVLCLGLALGCATGVDFVATSMLATGSMHIRAGVFATPDDFLWCFTAYAGAAILANLVLHRVAEFISYRNATLLGLAVAGAGCLLCASAGNIAQLALALAVQGLGAGGLFAASRTLLQLITAPPERPQLLWPFVLGALGMLATAPWITATLMLDAGWRTIFVVQAVGTAATGLLVALTYPRRVVPPRTPDLDTLVAMDWMTVGMLGVGALTLVHGLANFRLYAVSDSAITLAWPLAGLALMALAFLRLRRCADPWLDTHRIGGRRYLTGLAFFSIYACFAGFWNYLIPNLLQLGLGFTFESTGRIMTLTNTLGVAAGIAFIVQGARLPGTQRYLVLGYIMLAVAAWMLGTRVMTDLSMDRVAQVLLLQNAAVPFCLVLVAKLAFTETAIEDFPHAFQFKNIMRQVSIAAGTGLAAQGLQHGEAVARTHLVARVDSFGLPVPLGTSALTALSQQIDQQAVLVASANLLAILAASLLIVAAGAAWQRWLR